MQTFLPFEYFVKSANVLDNKRLGNQRNEAYGILQALLQGPYQYACPPNNKFRIVGFELKDCNKCGKRHAVLRRPTPWYQHPAVQMWKGYEFSLSVYGETICRVWIDRGFKDTVLNKFIETRQKLNNTGMPPWMGNEMLHLSHKSNLKRKNPAFYGLLWADIPDDLPYFWPTKGLTLEKPLIV